MATRSGLKDYTMVSEQLMCCMLSVACSENAYRFCLMLHMSCTKKDGIVQHMTAGIAPVMTTTRSFAPKSDLPRQALPIHSVHDEHF